MAGTLGSNWTADADEINDGYPILTWQASSTEEPDEPEVLAGDFDGNGEITLADVMGTLAAYKSGAELTDAQKAAVDTDGDGEVSLAEYMAVLAIYKQS